ncbi:hypothetical protein SYNPS1DRAFT_31794 [Syncephalis pseudoplumigaleata]|uniref:Uncharacterized protein n=1 Tax=Syncephalis pseudoplumigaleata TaxID=1712513 RepID=A0A4P9YRX1_9FUNG|nr:hypothetical protein SYNPS1DRAFT_31794 [Syncephalis pseudoplumigaleata]|eukprot:RKP22597.1 hypothetical protein SYNPS1DRAFT_31794 [Syncephalis pseudoplumigaleata]
MPLCVSAAAPSMLEQTQSPPLAQPTATLRRHRRRSSHHHLMNLPARPVSTSPYIQHGSSAAAAAAGYPTHRPRPVTPEDNEQPYNNMAAAVGTFMEDACQHPIPRSQSVRLCGEANGSAPPLRPLDILAPCPKKAGGHMGSGWQRWMAGFPPTSASTAPHTDSPRHSGRMLARPLSFCFGEDLDLDGDLDEANRRMASLQREFSGNHARQASVEAEAEAEALAPVVVDLSLSVSNESPILDDLMRVSSGPAMAPLPEQQPSSSASLQAAHRPAIAIPSDREKQAHRGPISAAGESAAMAELMGIFSQPGGGGGSPTSLVGGELPAMPALMESDDTSEPWQVAIPATTSTQAALLEAAIMGSDSDTDVDDHCSSHAGNVSGHSIEQDDAHASNGHNPVEKAESARKSRKVPPRLNSLPSTTSSSSSSTTLRQAARPPVPAPSPRSPAPCP